MKTDDRSSTGFLLRLWFTEYDPADGAVYAPKLVDYSTILLYMV